MVDDEHIKPRWHALREVRFEYNADSLRLLLNGSKAMSTTGAADEERIFILLPCLLTMMVSISISRCQSDS